MGNRDKAVDMRGRALMGEYEGAFAKLDKEFLGIAQGQTGPLASDKIGALSGESGIAGNCDREVGRMLPGPAQINLGNG